MLWIEFVNSHPWDPLGHGQTQDRLEDAQWRKQFAKKWQLAPVTARQWAKPGRLGSLRDVLQRCVQSLVAGNLIAKRDLRSLNNYLSAKPVRPQINHKEGDYRIDLVSTTSGIESWIFAIAISFAQFLIECDPARLKMCDNPDCVWVFYDKTRSKTKRWCAASCGDLIKVREFRERQKRKTR